MRAAPRYLRPKTRFDIPTEITQEVGNLIVRWAYLEHCLQTIVWNLAQVIQPIGRLAIREPRAEERVRLIKDLAELRGIEIDETAARAIASQSRELALHRDVLAHGHWFYDDETKNWCVVLSRGKWSDDEPHHRSRSAVPEALNVTDVALQGIVKQLEAVIKLAELLSQQVEQQIEPPPEVPPSQFPRRKPKRGPNPSQPKHPRKSSQE
ncbi:hypothetical protein [Bradyrhizobium cenepequi]|uniref:hypothetical protein n=1 Tax=Bradyrhizobium cenepequi TaxID=2821403 RepID=UPI001CE3A6CD|nr:hypothetical protein [Bradyrhizobium cenepequi]MCA6105650.1 hypothetical protein [Bradyrhizobium cenepequi]